MKNAHLRMGSLQFTKVLRDTTIDITLRLDRMIAEHDADNRSARCHLLSVIGNDQEIAAIADEVHELKGETAQGAALGTIASCATRTIILTGTLNGGYADELFNILFRL